MTEETGVCNRTIEVWMPFPLEARRDSPTHRLLVPGDRRLKQIPMDPNGIALPDSAGTDCKLNRVACGDTVACDAMRHSPIGGADVQGRRRLWVQKVRAGGRWTAADALGHRCL